MATITFDYLNFQADRIEAVLASHRVPARVHGGTVSPRWMRFLLAAAPGAKISLVRNLSEEIALALGAENVRVSREGGHLSVEVPRPDAEAVRLMPLLRSLTHWPPHTACLGVSDDGRPLLLRLPSPDVTHVLVAGMTGSGKTELIRTMALSLAIGNRQSQLQFALIDPKSRGLSPLAGLPHLMAPVATDAEAAIALLDRLNEEMDRRDLEGTSLPRIVVVVDEVVDLLMTPSLGDRGGKLIEAALVRLAQRGREAGIHLILGAQKPSATALSTHIKANLPVRLVGRVGAADDARVATGISASGAEKLGGRGDFLVVASGQVTRFQAAHIPAHDWAEVMNTFNKYKRQL